MQNDLFVLVTRPTYVYIALVRTAVCCSVLQSVAECCRVLQCVAVCCSALHNHSSVRGMYVYCACTNGPILKFMYLSIKEPYFSAKQSCISAKEPGVSAKEPCSSGPFRSVLLCVAVCGNV